MLPRLGVSKRWRTTTERIVIGIGCVGLAVLAIAGFSLLHRVQAAEIGLPTHQGSGTPTKIQARLVASYGKLPLAKFCSSALIYWHDLWIES